MVRRNGLPARCLGLICAFGAASAHAEVIPWLYDVQVPVASQTAAERRQAASGAFAELLGRVTGATRLPDRAVIRAALRDAERYALRYKYTTVDPLAGSVNGAPTSLFLDLRFDAEAVLALLRDAQLPIWGSDRPAILVLLAVRRGVTGRMASGQGERTVPVGSWARRSHDQTDGAGAVIGADSVDVWHVGLAEQARRRGVALVWPLLDMGDSALTSAAVWGRFWELLEASATRYEPDFMLVGRAAPDQDGWTADWELRSLERYPMGPFDAVTDIDSALAVRRGRLSARFRHQAASPEAIAVAVADAVADALAARFAVRGGQARTHWATVYGAATVRGYAALLGYLTSREYIDHVAVRGATPSTLEIGMRTRSDKGQLEELLAQDDRLIVESAGGRLRIDWLDGR